MIASLFGLLLALPLADEAPALLEPSGEEFSSAVWSLAMFEDLVDRHPRLLAAIEAAEVARGQAIQAGLYPNPVVTGGTNQLGGQQSQYIATIDQEIVTAGKLRLDRQAECQRVRSLEAAAVATRYEILADVRAAFFTAIILQKRTERLRELATLTSSSAEKAKQLYQGGEGSLTDQLLLSSEASTALALSEAADTERWAAFQSLAAVSGIPATRVLLLDGNPFQSWPVPELDTVQQLLSNRNSRIDEQRFLITAARVRLARERVEPIPNLLIDAGYQRSVADPNNQALIQVGIPLPIWNRNQGNIRSARATIRRQQDDTRRLEYSLLAQATDALGSFAAAQKQVERFESEVLPATEKALALIQEGAKQGQFDVLRVLLAQRTLVNAQLAFLDAQDLRLASLATLSGLLQWDDLSEIQSLENNPR